MKLYFIVFPDDEKLDAFVRAMSMADAVQYWKLLYPGRWDPGTECTVIEVPVDSGVIGVIPWETIVSKDIEP